MMSVKTRKKIRKLSNQLDSLRDSAETLDEAICAFEDAMDHVGLPEAKELGNSRDVARFKKVYARIRHDMWSMDRFADELESLSEEAFELSAKK